MMIIGLTGGPGTGKSLAARYLEEQSAIILSGDEAGRIVVEEIPSILRKLVKSFGMEILNSDGALNRNKLGSIAFGNPVSLATLNSIVHPPLLRLLKATVNKLKKSRRNKIIVIDAALIFEWGIANWCDYILVVTARQDIRIKRMMSQGLSRKEARNRIASQIPDKDKVALADYVIENNGARSTLKNKVNDFLLLLQRTEK
jgi:dephospho-CoA kinase